MGRSSGERLRRTEAMQENTRGDREASDRQPQYVHEVEQRRADGRGDQNARKRAIPPRLLELPGPEGERRRAGDEVEEATVEGAAVEQRRDQDRGGDGT